MTNFPYVSLANFFQPHLNKNSGKCLKPEQFLKAEHLLKHAFLYRDQSFYGPDG